MRPLIALEEMDWDYLLDSIEQKAEDIDDAKLAEIARLIRFELGWAK